MKTKIDFIYLLKKIELSEVDFNDLEVAAGGVSLSAFHKDIVAAINSYNRNITRYREGLRPAEVKKVVDPLRKSAWRLVKDMDRLIDRIGRDRRIGGYVRQEMEIVADSRFRKEIDFFAVKDAILLMAKCADEVALGVPEGGEDGPDGDPYISSLLVELHRIYIAAGGSCKYADTPIDFLDASCRKAGISWITRNAITNRLKNPVGENLGSSVG